ncbi:hypothetical protein IWW50_006080 [Coemansia erecta]|nr:hypothetical protein GGF43_002120 [Coemansia sp. RSA 2618]KAJ2817692.1 hypothetical protein IWW50_006080 [Coemansia erecta]
MTNVSLSDQLQNNIPSPTYAKGAAFMSFDNPLVTHILQSDVALKQHVIQQAAEPALLHSGKRAPSRSPTIGGIRRIMRRAHTPEGLVLHYESRLCSFLGIDNNGNADGLLSDDEDWQVIEMDDGMFSPFGRDMIFDEGDMVILSEALMHAQQSSTTRSSRIAAGIKSSLVTEWPIQDSFTRLIVHTMCRYYGLVSYSDTLDSGKCVLHICHPRFFRDDEVVNTPKVTFYQYLYNDSK